MIYMHKRRGKNQKEGEKKNPRSTKRYRQLKQETVLQEKKRKRVGSVRIYSKERKEGKRGGRGGVRGFVTGCASHSAL